MKRLIGTSVVMVLMALVAACQKQDISNVTTENTYVSDESVDGNAGPFDNLATDSPEANEGGVAANAN